MSAASTVARVRWDRVEPSEPCTSPDGHEHTEMLTAHSDVPVLIVCPRCGLPWTIVLLPEEATP